MIRDFTKSMLNFSWAISLFGVKQMTTMVMPEQSAQPMSQATEAFHAVTDATEEQLGGPFKEAFKVGEQLQKEFTDMTAPFLTFGGFDPGEVMRVPSDTIERFTNSFNARSQQEETPGADFT